MGLLRLREAREIGENYAIFHNRIGAEARLDFRRSLESTHYPEQRLVIEPTKRQEQTKIGQEPGLKGNGSGRFKPPVTPFYMIY